MLDPYIFIQLVLLLVHILDTDSLPEQVPVFLGSLHNLNLLFFLILTFHIVNN